MEVVHASANCKNKPLPFFGGVISDRLGVRLMSMVFAALICGGQLIFAIGMTMQNVDAGWYGA